MKRLCKINHTIIEIDLFGDWKQNVINNIGKLNLSYANNMTDEAKITRYMTYLRKIGGSKRISRRVHLSKEFKCPTDLQVGLQKLIEVIQTSGDFLPYMSKKLKQLDISDYMFNDWGIIHFHLGSELEKANSEYIVRTDNMVFAYFTDTDMYFINIFKHGEWTKESILAILYNNWPEILEPFILRGVDNIEPSITEEMRKDLRKVAVNTPVRLGDKSGNIIYIKPGGYTRSHDAMLDVLEYQKVHNCLKEIELDIKKTLNSDKINDVNINKYKFKLIYDEYFHIVEQHGHCSVNLELSLPI